MNNIFNLLGMLKSNPSQLAMSILQQAYQQRRINPMQFQMLSNSLQNGANPNQIIQQMLNSGMVSQQDYENARQQCCCDTKQAIADLKYTVATENCADRSALAEALQNVVNAQNANTQAILDKMCQQEIEQLKTQNANLQTQLNMQNLAASQATQTAQLIQDNNAQTAQLINRIAPYPVPAYQVANPYANNGCMCNNTCCGAAV